MEFLQGHQLTRALRSLATEKTRLKLAVAYWGSNSLSLLGLDPNRSDLEIVCCLKAGKSDPNVISRFRSKARQNDKLHAKVIWSRERAIVSSANVSSNGIPEEEQSATGLIEAGALVDEPRELANIRRWFDRLYAEAKPITKADLSAAAAAREQRTWGRAEPGRMKKRPLMEALREGGRLEFSKQRIYFVISKLQQSMRYEAATKRFVRKQATKLETTLNVSRKALGDLTWYTGWTNLPKGAVLIECIVVKDRIRYISICKTFDVQPNWFIKPGSERERVTFALPSGFKGFDYLLRKHDKEVIRASYHDLWNTGRGDQHGRIISLVDAAPILLKRNDLAGAI
jgi:hypothetical protein